MAESEVMPIHLSGLTGDMAALVDSEDYDRVVSHGGTWYAWRGLRGNVYALKGSRPAVAMHRLILNAPDGVSVDHINGDGLDNRRANLRLCSHSQNMKNQGPRNGRRFKGCYYNPKRLGRKKWQSSIRVDGKAINLGRFETELEAAKAYDDASAKYHGVFGRKNFVGGVPSQTISK